MSNHAPMVFDSLEPIEIPVSLGKLGDYTLREADEGAAIKFRDFQSRALKYGPDGQVMSIEGGGNSKALLVSLCLFKNETNRNGETVRTAVSQEIIKKWKTSVVSKLFDKAKEISGFDAEDTEEEIEEQIEKLQTRLDELRAKKADSGVKN